MADRRARPLSRLAILALLAPAAALAANPESVPLSPEAALTGGAVLASDDEGSGGWYNPASLGGIRWNSLQLGASAYSVGFIEIEEALTTTLPWGTIDGHARDFRYVSVPSVLALCFRLRDGLGASVGVWTPYHSAVGATVGGASSGPYPGVPGVEASYDQVYGLSARGDDTWGGLAVGWQARPRLRLGASLQGAYSTASSIVDLNTGIRTSSADPLQQGGHVNVSIRSDETLLGLRAVLGLQWDATDRVRLALVLRSPQLRVKAWSQTTRVTSVAALLPGFAPQEGQVIELVEPTAGLSVIETGRIYGGASWARGPWSFRAEVDWGPGLVRQIGSEKASWNVRLGAIWQMDRNVAIGAGLFRDAARSTASEGQLSLDYYGLSGGLNVRPAKVVRALGGGESWDLISGIAGRIAYGTGKGPGMTIVPFDLSQSVVPIFPGQESRGFQEVPARSLEGSLSFFTTLKF